MIYLYQVTNHCVPIYYFYSEINIRVLLEISNLKLRECLQFLCRIVCCSDCQFLETSGHPEALILWCFSTDVLVFIWVSVSLKYFRNRYYFLRRPILNVTVHDDREKWRR